MRPVGPSSPQIPLPSKLLNATSVLSFRCFVAVVQTQSFSSAARQLRLAPSTVTKHVKLLEGAVRVALVHRTTRRVSVTDAGARFYEQCLGILAEVDRAADTLVAEQVMNGHLRLTAPPAFVAGALGPRLPGFLAAYPGLTIDVIVSSDTLDLVRARIDVALMFGEEPPSKLKHIELMSCAMVLCASPHYLAAAPPLKIPNDLALHACLSARFSERAEDWPMLVNGRLHTMRVGSRLLSDNGELLKQACIEGAGVGCFYEFHVREDLNNGRLVRVLNDYTVRPKNLYAVMTNHLIIKPQLKALMSFINGICETIK